MWSPQIARLLAAALRRNPRLHLVVVVPRHPDVDGRFALPPNEVGRLQAIETCRSAAPDRVHVFDLENREGTPVYVHAKVAVIDDVWACVGQREPQPTLVEPRQRAVLRRPRRDAGRAASPWIRRGSATAPAPSPASCGSRSLASTSSCPRTAARTPTCSTPTASCASSGPPPTGSTRGSEAGRAGPRPPGRLRPHQPETLPVPMKAWAMPIYRLVYDPDGRPLRARLRGEW